MIDLKPHRLWIGLLGAALILEAAQPWLSGAARQQTERKIAMQKTELAEAQKALTQLRADIEATKNLQNEIGEAEAERTLAFTDRLRAGTILENSPAARRGSRAATSAAYAGSPSRKASSGRLAGVGSGAAGASSP